MLEHLNAHYDDILTWAYMYDTARMAAKKMIVNCLLNRVEVYRDYKLQIDFNMDVEQFSMGMDIVAIAAESKNPTSEEVRFSFTISW